MTMCILPETGRKGEPAPWNKNLSREVVVFADSLVPSCMLRETLKRRLNKELWASTGTSAFLQS